MQIIMIWSINGDLTERLAQQDDYGGHGAMKHFYLVFQGNCEIGGDQNELPVP